MPEGINHSTNELVAYISLADGRKLGYKEYGIPNGFPIIALHGTPGSRIWFEEDDTLSPIGGLKKFIQQIPNYHPHFIEGKGHFLDEDEDLWRRILQSLKP